MLYLSSQEVVLLQAVYLDSTSASEFLAFYFNRFAFTEQTYTRLVAPGSNPIDYFWAKKAVFMVAWDCHKYSSIEKTMIIPFDSLK